MTTVNTHITADEMRISVKGNATIQITIYHNGQPLWSSESASMTYGDTYTLKPITLMMPVTLTED